MSKIFLNTKQIKKMYDMAASRSIRDEVMLRIMSNTGMRISDVRSLLVEDIASPDGIVYTSIRKKMQKTGIYVERFINEITREKIQQYLPMIIGKSIYLFPGLSLTKPIGRTYCHELFKDILSKIMPDGTDFSAASTHTLRRSVAMLLAGATSIQVASTFLGHKSIASTTAYLSQEILGKEAREFLDKNLRF